MADYADAKHRPHATHFGDRPKTGIDEGPEGLSVELTAWGPQRQLFTSMYDFMQANWGDEPSRTSQREATFLADERVPEPMATLTGWTRLDENERAYVVSAFAGKTLPQVLEGLMFWFTIDGCSRASTHQLVRTRIGAGFSQHGGRDNDWRMRRWTMPETIVRATEAITPTGLQTLEQAGLKHCLKDMAPIDREDDLSTRIDHLLAQQKQLYADLVDAGIPYQDARRMLPMGTQTYLHAHYTYSALNGVLSNRLEHIMDWEINCVAQLMLREIHKQCPPLLWQFLGSHSDKAHYAKFAGLESWPADGKYPSPYERCACGHARANHVAAEGGIYCEVCERCMEYRAVDVLPRFHTAEQNPFWVLTPEAMTGGPVEWIPSNGTYPWEVLHARRS